MSNSVADALFDPAVVQDPFDYYRHLRTTEPVHEVAPGAFLVTRMDLIHEVVNKTTTYSSVFRAFLHKGDWAEGGLRSLAGGDVADQADVPGAIATADPPAHERQRKVLTKKFSAASIRAMEPGFRALVADALAAVGDDGRIEWMSEVAEPLPMTMVARLLGLSDADSPKLKELGYALVDRIGGYVTEAEIEALDAAGLEQIAPLIDAYTAARSGSDAYGEDGILTIVARAVDAGELDDLEAIGILSVLVAAGGESTTSLLGTAVRILAERPDLQDELRADPSLIPAFVEEALRWDPPFRGHYRVTTEDTELNGTPIPSGAHVLLVWPAANRDDSAYDAPDEVRLDRPNPRYHVGFGWGIHLCLGAPLARLEGRVALEELLASTRRFRLETDDLPYHPSLLVRRLDALPLVLERA